MDVVNVATLLKNKRSLLYIWGICSFISLCISYTFQFLMPSEESRMYRLISGQRPLLRFFLTHHTHTCGLLVFEDTDRSIQDKVQTLILFCIFQTSSSMMNVLLLKDPKSGDLASDPYVQVSTVGK